MHDDGLLGRLQWERGAWGAAVKSCSCSLVCVARGAKRAASPTVLSPQPTHC